MAKEIERKFLVENHGYRAMATGRREITQGYLSADPDRTVRVRVADDRAFITVKTRSVGCTRSEWEYPIPVDDARAMLRACTGTLIEKTRWLVPAAEEGLMWEVDEFHGAHEGLVVAEIELPSEATPFTPAPFIGREVTGDAAYYNSSLARIG